MTQALILFPSMKTGMDISILFGLVYLEKLATMAYFLILLAIGIFLH